MEIVVGLLAFLFGLGASYFLYPYFAKAQYEKREQESRRILKDAKTKEREALLEAKDKILEMKHKAQEEIKEERRQLEKEQKRIISKEDTLEKRYEAIDKKLQQIEQSRESLDDLRKDLEKEREEITNKLMKIAEYTKKQAKEELLSRIEAEVKDDALRLIHEVENATKLEADRRARDVIVQAMQRCASDVSSEVTVMSVPIPSDDMKGRIIGKEGRNIRTLEKETGVDFIVDDTPERIIISSFDPVRREVARVALTKLVSDGRIQPARIEEIVDKAKKEVDRVIMETGQKAVMEVKIKGLPAELVQLVGALRYRTSYGQNILKHSIECAHLAAMIAQEIGADVTISRKAAFLHDIGKAIDHNHEGTHAQLGADLLERFKINKRICYAVRAHHEEVPLKSPEDFVVVVADSISGARPGARRDSVENYLERLRNLEEIATKVEGVAQAYAISAGRELRMLVNPDDVDDLMAKKIARNVAKEVQETLDYPGQIKVNVIRETRSVEYAK